MAIKVVIERQVVPGQETAVRQLLKQIRARCLEEGGYISGETLRDSEDPQNVVVISTWFGLMDWRKWYRSNDRQDFSVRLRPLLAGPERIRVLVEGLTAEHAGA